MSGKPNVVRRTLVWWFRPPISPYVTVNFAVDATFAKAYLAKLAAAGTRVTLNHLVAAAVARTLVEHPYANGRVIGQRIVLARRVGIAMPVNLLDSAGLGREVSIATVDDVEAMTLAELAARTSRTLGAEREGKPKNPLIQTMVGLGARVPHTVFKGALHVVDRVANSPLVGDAVYHHFGVTTALSNVGSTMKAVDGVWFRGADLHPPPRLMQVGTFWGTSTLQDEVVPVEGVPAVRPMLPVLLLFDHRLIDGVRGSKVIQTFGRVLRDPEAAFGASAEGRIGG